MCSVVCSIMQAYIHLQNIPFLTFQDSQSQYIHLISSQSCHQFQATLENINRNEVSWSILFVQNAQSYSLVFC
jgi:hypothetical protein